MTSFSGHAYKELNKVKKFLLIVLILTQTAFAQKIKVAESFSQLPKGKNIILIFAMEYCPYCIRQERSILKRVKPKFEDMGYFKVMKGTDLFQELIETGNFGEVEYFPTTYILKIDSDDQIDVKYPFMGFQRSSNIIDILNDKEIMGD